MFKLIGLRKILLIKLLILLTFLGFLFFILNEQNKNNLIKDTFNPSDKAAFQLQSIFVGERMPNIGITLDGAVIATWGKESVLARLSRDGGVTWEEELTVAKIGIHGGGLTVDEISGDIILFAQEKHPPATIYMYRSRDNGGTWQKEVTTIAKDVNNNEPQMHMAEHGVTLMHGEHKGRLIRSSRVYGDAGAYNIAIYSDDHGKTWAASTPFPLMGTGEGAIVELNDGRLYFTSRTHWFNEVDDFKSNRASAWSYDGGETWVDLEYSAILPDGPRYREVDSKGSAYNGHFGMMAGMTVYPVDGHDVLIYSNADISSHERKKMTVWASFDGGQTWPVKRLVHDGYSAYSSLASGRRGTVTEGWVYLQFEGGGEKGYEGSYLARFNMAWLIGGILTGDGKIPMWVKSIII